MRYAIYTILGLITLGMISTAVLSQETDQNWRLIYRPMIAKQSEGWEGLSALCITKEQVIAVANFFGLKSGMAAPEAMFLGTQSGPAVLVEFKDGCAVSAKRVTQ
jgi:hypothetical protein